MIWDQGCTLTDGHLEQIFQQAIEAFESTWNGSIVRATVATLSAVLALWIALGSALSVSAIAMLQAREGSALIRLIVWLRIDSEDDALKQTWAVRPAPKEKEFTDAARDWVAETMDEAFDKCGIPHETPTSSPLPPSGARMTGQPALSQGKKKPSS